MDTFARDHLPPAALWPTIEFTTPELRYPERLNAATELIDVPAAKFGPDRPALRTPSGESLVLRRSAHPRQPGRSGAHRGPRSAGGTTGLLRSPNNPWTVAAWLGVLKAGGVVVTTMAALRARELDARPRADPSVDRVGGQPVRRRRIGHRPGVADGSWSYDALAARCRNEVGGVHRRGHRRRRRGAAGAHVRQHRISEDHRALPPRHPVHRQHLRPSRAAAGRGRPRRLHGAVRLHLRPRHARRVPAASGRLRSADRDRDARSARGSGGDGTGSRCSRPRRPRTRRSCATASTRSSVACGPRCRQASTSRCGPGNGCGIGSASG